MGASHARISDEPVLEVPAEATARYYEGHVTLGYQIDFSKVTSAFDVARARNGGSDNDTSQAAWRVRLEVKGRADVPWPHLRVDMEQ